MENKRSIKLIGIGDAGFCICVQLMMDYNPDVSFVGLSTTEGEEDRIQHFISNSDIVIIVAGMGGKAGTAGASVVARLAREKGISTEVYVTVPFELEGPERMQAALAGIEQLKYKVDVLTVYSLDKLLAELSGKADLGEVIMRADKIIADNLMERIKHLQRPGIIDLMRDDEKSRARFERMARKVRRSCEARRKKARFESKKQNHA